MKLGLTATTRQLSCAMGSQCIIVIVIMMRMMMMMMATAGVITITSGDGKSETLTAGVRVFMVLTMLMTRVHNGDGVKIRAPFWVPLIVAAVLY